MGSWIDALASRSGPLHTAATHFAAEHGLEHDPPRGVSGLRTLSGLITSARSDESDADHGEQQFVEGAGAYLGLLLLDHLPNGAHVSNAGEHRLHLGRHGFFDPFAAVADALDAHDPPRALLAAVKLAEAEAAGSGPIARVALELLAQLEDSEARLIRQFDRKLWIELEGQHIELDLERLISVTRDEPQGVLKHAVSRLCASLVASATPLLSWEEAKERLYPRLVGPAFLSGLPDQKDLHLLHLGSGVWETLVLRYRERARYVRQAEVETWSKDGAQPRAQALLNLARSCERARFLQHATPHGPIVVAQSRDGLDAARLLLPTLHSVLAETLGSPFLAATPHRDTLLACPLGPAELIETFEQRVDEAVRSAPHAISGTLWLVTGPGEMRPWRESD